MKAQQQVKQSQKQIADVIFPHDKKENQLANQLIKKISKKKNEISRKVTYKIMLLNNKYFGMKVFGDLIITSTGQIKLCSALIHVSFGYQSKSQSIEYNKETNCYQIKLAPYFHAPFCSVQDAFKLVDDRQLENINLKILFERLDKRISYVQQKIKYLLTSNSQQVNRDEQFNSFQQSCQKYLQMLSEKGQQVSDEKLTKSFENLEYYETLSFQECFQHFQEETKNGEEALRQNPNSFCGFLYDLQIQNQIFSHKKDNSFNFKQLKDISCQGMFSYVIGRLNLEKNDLELAYYGYSKGYLDLLGLDQQSLINLTLRDKQIDLVRDTSDITRISALQLNSRLNGGPQYDEAINIVTFDGFPIKIYQKQRKVLLKQFQSTLIHQYQFSITEIDVDLNDLQNLMDYRQQLAAKQNSLPMEALIQRELSYKFEDIEYSVHSENFIDKYYKENLVSLKNIHHNKLVKTSKKRCKVRRLEQKDPLKQIEAICV